MSDFAKLAKEYYDSGLSCSESVVKAAYDSGLFKTADFNEFFKISSMFSGGMTSGCLCGAVAGSQIVLGMIFGRNISETTAKNKDVAAEFIQKFKEKNKAVCCRVLSGPYEINPAERRKHCSGLVEDCAQIIEQIIIKHLKRSLHVSK